MGGAPARMVSDKSARFWVGEAMRRARGGIMVSSPARRMTGYSSERVQVGMQRTRWRGQHEDAVRSSLRAIHWNRGRSDAICKEAMR